ncbi:MAG: M36 family metallopeptidase [Candidatus Aminicenantes bacterium]|nr:M36 family metallopeptidase [Candidatus Aminicenantes bacterium]
MIDLKKANVRWNREDYVPKKVSGFESKPGKGDPREIADGFLKENKDTLKITCQLSDLRYEKVSRSLGGGAVLYQQYFEGTPIHGGWVAVHIDNKNQVFLVKNDTVPIDKLQTRVKAKKAAPLPEEKIEAAVQNFIKGHGALNTEIEKEKVIYPLKGNLRAVWKVKFGTENPAASWILFIDMSTGQIIEERDVLRKLNGKGKVFRPNPVVALNRDDLEDKDDLDQPEFNAAYKTVTLKELDGSASLKGPYVDLTRTKNYAKAPDGKFMYTRGDKHFEEVMVYYHLDAAQRYIQSLGFSGDKGILNRPIKANAHGIPDDNSYYDPSPNKKDLTFGDGNVDDAEDADIILHEYGHAIQDGIVPGFGQAAEGTAMGEGFGDYMAGTRFNDYKKGDRKLRVGEWDAKGYGPSEQCLRRLDSTKHYPEDMEGECHVDGEIWSACLWKVRKLLGRAKADTVILESHFYLNQYADFKDGAEAIIMAEKNIYGGKRTAGLTKIFKTRGILT